MREKMWWTGGPSRIVALIALLGLTACIGGDDLTGPDPVPLEDEEFDPALEVDLAAMEVTEEGLYYLDLEVGEGEIVEVGDSITAHFEGWLADGTLFESTHEGTAEGDADEPGPAEFQIGVGTLIQGFELGVPGMREGGKRRLVIPYYLGFGALSDEVIPPYANLVFEIEVLEVTASEEIDPED